jgi:hypothetical protein
LLVHYHGIRDFGLLFPQIAEPTLRKRLGEFYEEAEKVFEVAAWLSFALNAAAIYEGLLGWRLGRKEGTLDELTEEAFQRQLIDEGERSTINAARKARNLVHASQHHRPFVSRVDAMDMRMVMDRLVRAFSNQFAEPRKDVTRRANPCVFVPSRSPAAWKRLLANPERQWRIGCSARALANSWQEAEELPSEVRRVLSRTFPEIRALICIPEHKVSLPGGGGSSQTDLWVLGRSRDDLVSIAVEGKISETFGPTTEEWLVDASVGKRKRLKFLSELLGCTQEIPGRVRYQLLHRAASAILEARRFRARHAMLLVHSFSPTNEWLDDFITFGKMLGVEAGVDQLTPVGDCSGVSFSLGWICGDEAYLSS